MFAAIIGLVGVLVGGLITGLQNAWLERTRTKRQTVLAERQIRLILDTSVRRLFTAVQERRWWAEPERLPLGQWKDQWPSLDPDMPQAVLKDLEDAFSVLRGRADRT